MSRMRKRLAAGLLLAAAAVPIAVFAGTTAARTSAKKPIIIGAAMDFTANMSPYDTPAFYAAELRAKQINAKGGVLGRKLVIKKCDHQLKKQKECAAKLIGQGAAVGMVTCDVEYAAPATQEFINQGMLALAPCIGTDQQGPKRFGAKGRLAFTLGSIAQDEGAAMAEYSYSAKHWRTAVIVKDNLLAYFRNVADAFKVRFKQLGGKVVQEESFTSFDKTVNNAISKVSRTKADVICFVTAFTDLPTFVSGIRSLGNKTPIINSWGGDGNYWWTKSPKVTNYYYVTYGSLFGDDPVPAVNRLVKQVAQLNGGKLPATGSFVPGADLIDALVAAIKKTKSTDGAKLATAFEHFRKLRATSGTITYSPSLHGVTHRAYRVMLVQNNKGKFLRLWVTKKDANIG
jgi:branched-chain amino acid transport system substrate-binding protein